MGATNHRGPDQRSGLPANLFISSDPAAIAANAENLLQAGGKLLDHWRAVGDELTEFGKWWLKRNMEAVHKLTRCGNVDEVLKAQTDLGTRMTDAYIAESGKLAEMTTRAIFESLSWNGTLSVSAEARSLQAAE